MRSSLAGFWKLVFGFERERERERERYLRNRKRLLGFEVVFEYGCGAELWCVSLASSWVLFFHP